MLKEGTESRLPWLGHFQKTPLESCLGSLAHRGRPGTVTPFNTKILASLPPLAFPDHVIYLLLLRNGSQDVAVCYN